MRVERRAETMRRPFALGVIALLAIAARAADAQTDCEPDRCAVQAALEQECPCSQATNHGRHVSCVAHVVKRLADDGEIATNCKGKIKRCAARSICGKEGFVTCNIPVLGTCDATTNTCVEDPTLACTSEGVCVLGTRCKTKRSADLCLAKGGTVGTSPTCCSDCVTPAP
jgi:hypothetical protein